MGGVSIVFFFMHSLLHVITFFQILVDTKTIQKEINMLSGKLDRTFTVTDELIFKVSGFGSPCSLCYLQAYVLLVTHLYNYHFSQMNTLNVFIRGDPPDHLS